MGTRYSPSTTHPATHTPGTPPWHGSLVSMAPHGHVPDLNMVVGLKSVRQLTLYVLFSGFPGMTEVYNLTVAGNPDDH